MVFAFEIPKPIKSCGIYTPYWTKNEDGEKIVNPHKNKVSATLMDLKDSKNRNHQKAVTFFTDLFSRYFEQNGLGTYDRHLKGVTIAIVPSSQKGVVSRALFDIAISTAKILNNKGYNITVDPTVFIRTKTIQKLHQGGDRHIGVHLQSINVNPEHLVDLRLSRIIILDDVSTTGGSLRACCQLLENQGIPSANIELVSLLKTATL
ncbi:phosphoribosyltransferase [Photobacterium damselae]|uniref:phosphoribosyltransferase n=1 Tax=Photobacterium damselae TaxID=38293 RepID=UPI00165DF840|nr:phosphoribosyltransferase [Photobacterium damselae]